MQDVPEEVSKLLGEANILYANSRYQDAIPLLTEAITRSPNLQVRCCLCGMFLHVRRHTSCYFCCFSKKEKMYSGCSVLV